MAITTYAELKTAVSNWAHRADLANYLDDLVTLAETRIMREVRAQDMETALSVTIAAGVATVPTGFLGLKNAYVDASPTRQLQIVSPAAIFSRYPTRAAEDVPAFISVDAGSFIFGPYPDSTYTIKGTYWKRQGPLSSAVYALFTSHPDLYLFAALCETKAFEQADKRIPMWEAKYREIRDAVNNQASNINYSGGMVVSLG